MSRRLLLAEPDPPSRALMERVLSAEGFAVDAASSAHDARASLDAALFEIAIVDELGGTRGALEEVRWLRRHYPALPVIVTGTRLGRHALHELIRLRVADALDKPFTPEELREAVARAADLGAAQRTEALEYDAALTEARRAIATARIDEARLALGRAQATSPLDGEIMVLVALTAELSGRDEDAGRGYRAALALRDTEAALPPDPHEGLVRLNAYGGAAPVAALGPSRASKPIWLVSDPPIELAKSAIPEEAEVILLSLGITTAPPAALFLRDGDVKRAFALMTGALRPELIARALTELGAGPLVATPDTAARIDLARVEQLRSAAGR